MQPWQFAATSGSTGSRVVSLGQPGLMEPFKGPAPDFWTLGVAELALEGHQSGDLLLQGQPGHGAVNSPSQARGNPSDQVLARCLRTSAWTTCAWKTFPRNSLISAGNV